MNAPDVRREAQEVFNLISPMMAQATPGHNLAVFRGTLAAIVADMMVHKGILDDKRYEKCCQYIWLALRDVADYLDGRLEELPNETDSAEED